jgi:AraC-like DNA-binding protein
MSGSGPVQVEQDSRGILDPWLLRQRVRLTRYPAGAALEALVEWFWAVQWDLPPGAAHRQHVLTHPGAIISVGNANARPGDRRVRPVEARLYGVARRLTTRVLVAHGWTVAALTWPGGLGAFVAGSAADYTGKVVPLGQAIALGEAELLREIAAEPAEEARVKLLAAALERAVDPARVPPASQVAAIARIAETDRSVRRLADLCRAAGTGQRTLQRMFLRYAGVSPTWVIRRYRLLEAAEAVREGQRVPWAEMAADLGYADQAHLIRDFRAAIGQTPAAYAQAQAGRIPRLRCWGRRN